MVILKLLFRRDFPVSLANLFYWHFLKNTSVLVFVYLPSTLVQPPTSPSLSFIPQHQYRVLVVQHYSTANGASPSWSL